MYTRACGTNPAGFVAALLDPDADLPPGLIGPDGGAAPRRFAVCRNTVAALLTRALKAAFVHRSQNRWARRSSVQCAQSSFALSRHGRRNWRFAAVLFGYFWTSALTKLVRPFLPTIGAHAQIYPVLSDVVGNDPA